MEIEAAPAHSLFFFLCCLSTLIPQSNSEGRKGDSLQEKGSGENSGKIMKMGAHRAIHPSLSPSCRVSRAQSLLERGRPRVTNRERRLIMGARGGVRFA